MYDVIVLGGGPAGYRAALELNRRDKKVLLIESRKLGGTCLHEGCIPTKSLLASSKKFTDYKKYVSGFDVAAANEKKENDIRKLHMGLKSRLEQSGIEIIYAEGKVVPNDNGKVVVMADETEYEAEKLIIATGSINRELNIDGLQEAVHKGIAVYSNQFFALNDIGKRILIIGGGVIGIEFAAYFSAIDREVTILECQPDILGNVIDDDIRTVLSSSLARNGVEIITDCKIEAIEEDCVIYEKDGTIEEITVDLIVIAGGRTGNISSLGTEIETKHGFVQVDEYFRTSLPNVYACGDVIGRNMLAHVAYKEAETVVENICGNKAEMKYHAIPSVVYCNPEIAVVGLSENQCKKQGIEYTVKKASMNYSSRYLIEYGNQQGVCKLIFNNEGVIIGAQLIGNGSSEMIFVLEDMINQGLTEQEIAEKIYPHPSLVEIIKETVQM